MIDVMSFPVTKDQLGKMTPSERGLLLLLGHGSNQVNVLWKLVIVSTNRMPTDPIDARVSGAQTQIIVRMMIGVLREVWRLVEGRFLGSKLGREFEPLLDAASRAALASLKNRFGGPQIRRAARVRRYAGGKRAEPARPQEQRMAQGITSLTRQGKKAPELKKTLESRKALERKKALEPRKTIEARKAIEPKAAKPKAPWPDWPRPLSA